VTRQRIWLVLIGLFLLTSVPAAAQRGATFEEKPLYQSDNFDAVLRANRKGQYCAPKMMVIVYASNDIIFAGERAELHKFFDQLPDLLRADCNRVRAAAVRAFFEQKRVYTANLSNIHRGAVRLSERLQSRKIRDKYSAAAQPGQAPQPARRGRTAPPQPAPAEPSRAGSLFAAATAGEQCNVLTSWAQRLLDEYPDFPVTTPNTGDMPPKAANLLGDGDFVPVFGEPYDQTTAEFRALVWNRIYARCPKKMRWTQWIGALFKMSFREDGYLSNPRELAAAVKQGRAARAWISQQETQFEALPATRAGLEALNDIDAQARQKVATPWPSEQAAFTARLAARRSGVGLAVAEAEVAALPGEPDSLNRLQAIMTSTRALVIDRDRARLAALADTATRRGDEIAAAMLEGFTAELAALPPTFAGARDSLSRYGRVARLLDEAASKRKADFARAATARADAIYDSLVAKSMANIAAGGGGWRQALLLVGLVEANSGKFAKTRARGRIAELNAAAKKRAVTMIESGVPAFERELAGFENSWKGLKRLDEDDKRLRQNQRAFAGLQAYRPVLAARRAEMIEVLGERAVAEVTRTGRDMASIPKMAAQAQAHRKRFAAIGATGAVAKLDGAMREHVARILRDELPAYKAALAKLPPTRDTAKQLAASAALFAKRAKTWPGFAAYDEAARQHRQTVLAAVCANAVEASGIAEGLAGREILAATGAMSLRDFVCALDERGHRVAELSSAGGDSRVMKIA